MYPFKVQDIGSYKTVDILHTPPVGILIILCQERFRESAPVHKSFQINGNWNRTCFGRRKRKEPVCEISACKGIPALPEHFKPGAPGDKDHHMIRFGVIYPFKMVFPTWHFMDLIQD